MQKIYIFFFFIFISASLSAQDTTIYVLKGKIYEENSHNILAGSYVINQNRVMGVQVDTSGSYQILFRKGDIIVVRNIGYQQQTLNTEFMLIDSNVVERNFFMKKQVYPIPAVNIYAMRWAGFVYDMQHTELPEAKTQKRINEWVKRNLENEDLELVAAKPGFIIPFKTHYERQLKMIEKYKKNEDLNRIANEKFNKELVAKVTGLQGKELDNFMKSYCNFDRDFIISTSEYDLITIVQDIYAEYKQMKKK